MSNCKNNNTAVKLSFDQIRECLRNNIPVYSVIKTADGKYELQKFELISCKYYRMQEWYKVAPGTGRGLGHNNSYAITCKVHTYDKIGNKRGSRIIERNLLDYNNAVKLLEYLNSK